ncbi:uncharacterized protein V6R79_014200 [Siganus canaliculatus]
MTGTPVPGRGVAARWTFTRLKGRPDTAMLFTYRSRSVHGTVLPPSPGLPVRTGGTNTQRLLERGPVAM